MSEAALTERQKQAVARRARECCEYCQSQARFSPDPFSVEHIVPRSRGGTDADTNLAWSCQGCNNRKYTSVEALDPVSGETALLYHPRQQRWHEHFAWNEDYEAATESCRCSESPACSAPYRCASSCRPGRAVIRCSTSLALLRRYRSADAAHRQCVPVTGGVT
jgi:hypothetical protein